MLTEKESSYASLVYVLNHLVSSCELRMWQGTLKARANQKQAIYIVQ